MSEPLVKKFTPVPPVPMVPKLLMFVVPELTKIPLPMVPLPPMIVACRTVHATVRNAVAILQEYTGIGALYHGEGVGYWGGAPLANTPLKYPVILALVSAVLPFTTLPVATLVPLVPKLMPSPPPATVAKLLTATEPMLMKMPPPVVPLPPMILAVVTAELPFTTEPLAPTVPLSWRKLSALSATADGCKVRDCCRTGTHEDTRAACAAAANDSALVSAALLLAMLPPPPRKIPSKILALMDAKLATPMEPLAKIPLLLPVISEVVTAVLPFTTVPVAFTEPLVLKLIPVLPPLIVPKTCWCHQANPS